MNAFARAQWHWDDMLPDDPPDFRERVDVDDWLQSGIESLFDQGNVTIPNAYGRSKVVATHDEFVSRVVDHLAAQQDRTYAVELILIEIIKRGFKRDRLYQLAVQALGAADGFDTAIHAIATNLLDPHVEAYVEAEADCLALEARCGF